MKSSVVNIPDYRNIPVPDNMLTIEIPSWDAVAQPLINQAVSQYEAMVNEPVDELTDQMVQLLNLPEIESVNQLTRYGIEVFEKQQKQFKFYNDILPFILTFYAENSNVIINSEEQDIFTVDYKEQVEDFASEAQMTLEEYGSSQLNLTGDIEQQIEQRALEDFIFKIIALHIFELNGGRLDNTAYEEFILKNVLHNQADEIELRERLSYDQFRNVMPEMALSQQIYEYFINKITMKINPDAEIKF